jgi:hypothetical protein
VSDGLPPQPPLPHFDLSDPDGDPVTVGALERFLEERGVPKDWELQIRLAGDRVIILGLDIEDIHFEQGKMMLVTGSDKVIHVEPLTIEGLEGGE